MLFDLARKLRDFRPGSIAEGLVELSQVKSALLRVAEAHCGRAARSVVGDDLVEFLTLPHSPRRIQAA